MVEEIYELYGAPPGDAAETAIDMDMDKRYLEEWELNEYLADPTPTITESPASVMGLEKRCDETDLALKKRDEIKTSKTSRMTSTGGKVRTSTSKETSTTTRKTSSARGNSTTLHSKKTSMTTRKTSNGEKTTATPHSKKALPTHDAKAHRTEEYESTEMFGTFKTKKVFLE